MSNTPAEKEEIEEDFLSVDPEVPGQKFCCISFLSPEKILANKDRQFFGEFMKYQIQRLRYTATTDFLADFVRRHNGLDVAQRKEKLVLADVSEAWTDFSQKRLPTARDFKDIEEAQGDFLHHHEERLEKEFHEKNDFQTTMRGVKVRGTQSSQREAANQAKKLAKFDKTFDVQVGQVGQWLPWDPRPEGVKDQEQQNEELNKLSKKQTEMEETRKEVFQAETEARKAAARADAAAAAATGTPGIAEALQRQRERGEGPAASGGASAAAAGGGGGGGAMFGDNIIMSRPEGMGTMAEDPRGDGGGAEGAEAEEEE